MLANGAIGLLLASLFAPTIQAQTCGYHFKKISILDSNGGNISGAMFEFVGVLSSGDFSEFAKSKGFPKFYGPFISPKIFQADVEKLKTRIAPLNLKEDYCGNPLKQQYNVTKAKNVQDWVRGNEPSTNKFGICSVEDNYVIYLLKISAAGYTTDFYLGTFFAGCDSYSFVLSKRK
jgi:hypothetical protein